MLEADEKAAVHRKSSWKVEEAALGNVAAVEQKGDVRKRDITNSNTSIIQYTQSPTLQILHEDWEMQ
eukprot:11745928-Prorocentrum_lima.AAC.1